MPPRKRKIAIIQQDELPRNTRSSAKKVLMSTADLEASTATKASMHLKNSSVSAENLTTAAFNDNGQINKKTNETHHEITILKVPEEKDDDLSSECDWEDVEDLEIAIKDDDDKEPNIPKEGVEITLELPEAHKKRRAKKEFDLAAYVRRKVFRFKKEVQENMHKVHLLCLLGHGIRVNDISKEDILLGVALSLIPDEFFSQPKKKNKQPAQKVIETLMEWYRNKFSLIPEGNNPKSCTDYGIMHFLNSFENGSATSEIVYVTLFLACVRSIGVDARLIISLQPIPFKMAKGVNATTKKSKSADKEINGEENVKKKPRVADKQSLDTVHAMKPMHNSINSSKNKSSLKTSNKATSVLENEDAFESGRRSSSRTSKLKVSYNEDSESDHKDEDKVKEKSGKRLHQRSCKLVEELKIKDPTQDTAKRIKKEGDLDEDFKPDLEESRVPKGIRKNRKALSSDDDEDEGGNKNDGKAVKINTLGTDQWIEVYDDSARRWICVDCICGTVDQVKNLEDNATKPISYVLSFDGKGYIKDVTQRYASSWLSHTRKLRVDADWWLETLQPYRGPKSKRDKLEDEQLEDNLLERPLPTAISEFKNHPLYALKRHLLKFEGIYPSEAVPVGFIRGEPIYSRECVKELHSRETWLKEARLVRIGETAYKVVKARPKWIRMTGEFQTALPLELFGEWQTEVYVPPKAENGKVPRNDYGNVELFKPTMLPKGTVHIQIPGLNRVAKKLGIDCAPAMIGWDFHGGGSHPTFDGWVVCKEFKETLLLAWDEEQVNIEKREKEKREKRVYGNWRRLIRGLLIKERIRIRYAIDAPLMTDEPQSKTSNENNGSKGKIKRKNANL